MKKNSKRTKKIRNLVFVCVLSAILLTVSTYAWFVGLQTVRVNSFEVKIAATEGLMLSLDGETWVTELDTLTANQYKDNTNQWLTETDEDGNLISDGLIPMSSVGDINTTSSRLRLYEKGSLTATKGGYRLLTSEVANTGSSEADGYVAFDLFIRNMSGEAYYATNNIDNEEAIYLTYDSEVTVGTSGVKDTGIENSVRVAFAQIGRVENQEYSSADGATYPVSTVTGITCETKGAVTGICRTATIWEPNDTKHIANAISWYNASCRARSGSSSAFEYTADEATSDGLKACSTIENGKFYPTYAISREINIADRVDVYDGFAYNNYTANTVEPNDTTATGATTFSAYTTAKASDDFDADDYKLVAADTFTETERGIAGDSSTATGASRNVFMTLAPNSITKVRVYVYIEGQDIDNYDYAQLGKAISVKFGFTKERYTTDDYDNEPVSIIPGAENTKVVDLEVEGTVTDVTNAVYSDGVFHTLTNTTEFTFKLDGTEKTATYQNDAWTVQ